MIALETGSVWGADVVMLQEPYVEREGYNISHPGYRLVRGGQTMTAIRRDTHLEISEVDKGGEGDVQVFDIRYLSGRKMRLVNVYDQLRQEGGVRSQADRHRQQDGARLWNRKRTSWEEIGMLTVIDGTLSAHQNEM